MTDDVTQSGGSNEPDPYVPRLPDPPAAATPPLPPPPFAPPPPTALSPAQPPRRDKRRVNVLAGVLVAAGVAVGLVVVGWMVSDDLDGDSTERDEDGAITEAGDVDINLLQVGDCVDLEQDVIDAVSSSAVAEDAEVSRVRAVPCGQEHNGEVIHHDRSYFAEADGPPDPATAFRVATIDCLEHLEVYTATPAEIGTLDVNPITPVEEGWPDDRGLLCIGVTWSDGFEEIVRTAGSLAFEPATTPRPRPDFELFSESGVGDCFDLRELFEDDPDAVVGLFGRLVPCSEPHTAEVVANERRHYADAAVPPGLEDGEPDEFCTAALESYTGQPYEESPYGYLALVPSEFTWDLDDRSLTCLGFTFDDVGVIHPTGSMAAP